MSHALQFKLNSQCFFWALVCFQWKKLPHFSRGLYRALAGNTASFSS
jgi:hypothetical protein